MQRRKFIRNSVLFGAGLSVPSVMNGCEKSIIKPYFGNRLLIVQLNGGHDGLYAVAPQKNDLLNRLRPQLYSDLTKNSIEIPGDWLLHKDLKGLIPYLEHHEATLLPFVGYPNPNTSHFKSSEIWETGLLPNEKNPKKLGWTKGLINFNFLNLHDSLTLYDKNANKSASIWTESGTVNQYYEELKNTIRKNQIPFNLKKHLSETINDFNNFKGFYSSFNPNSVFEEQIDKAIFSIKSHLPYQIIHTQIGGFDTHLGQTNRLPKLYKELSRGLFQLKKNLPHELWAKTYVLVYSEFGRSLDENSTLGTDHGAAGLSVLLSGDRNFIKLFSSYSKEKINVIENGGDFVYVNHSIDFRLLYALLIEKLSA